MRESPEKSAYRAMMARCYRPSHPKYPRYGGRGISVCQRWRDSIDNFLYDVGIRPFPTASIGRIDNDGNYEPENVRWETPKQQMRNTSWNRIVTINGISKPMSQWSEETGLHWKTLWARIDSGWPEERLLLPSGQRAKKLTASQVAEIRELKSRRVRMKQIASRFNVTVSMIAKIVHGDAWKSAA